MHLVGFTVEMSFDGSFSVGEVINCVRRSVSGKRRDINKDYCV